MTNNQIILTKDGFKYVTDLVPGKDYLVTRSGTFTKFLGYGDISNAEYSVTLSTGETFTLSGDTVIDISNVGYNDIDTMYKECDTIAFLTKHNQPIDFASKSKVGYTSQRCYDIGYRRNFDDLMSVPVTKFSLRQRKEIIAGLVDNGETTIGDECISLQVPQEMHSVIIYILRSLGYSVHLSQGDQICFKPTIDCGLLPIRSRDKAAEVLYLSHKGDALVVYIAHIKECPIKNYYNLIIDSNESILLGYSLIPVCVQKRQD
jgi:hypothetical protein